MEAFQYQEGLEGVAGALSQLTSDLSAAHDRLNTAEDHWLEKYDAIAAELKEQMVEAERKGDPAEHVIVSTTRRRFPDLHRELREAKRAVERLTTQSSNRRSETTAYQSLIKSEHSIGGVEAGQGQRRGLPVHGQRRAAWRAKVKHRRPGARSVDGVPALAIPHTPWTPPCRVCKYPLIKSDTGCPRCKWEGRVHA